MTKRRMPTVERTERRDPCINQVREEIHPGPLFEVRPSGPDGGGFVVVICASCLNVLLINGRHALEVSRG
jgi:hypothetical protein